MKTSKMGWSCFAVLVLIQCLLISNVSFGQFTVTQTSSSPSISPRDGNTCVQDSYVPTNYRCVYGPSSSDSGTYSFTFEVSQEPVMVVGIPGEIKSYSFDSDHNQVSVSFEHTSYLSGIDVPGPPNDFSLTFISSIPVTSTELINALKGLYMSTNLSPSGWSLELPDITDDEEYGLGFELSAGDSVVGSAAFKFYFPAAVWQLYTALYGETVNPQNMAVFTDGYQASTTLTEITDEHNSTIGALVLANIDLSAGVNELEDYGDESVSSKSLALAFDSGGSLSKTITIDKQKPFSFTADDIQVTKKTVVELYGWVLDGVEGDKVRIVSKNKKANILRKKGKKAAQKYWKKGGKKVSLDSNLRYSLTQKMAKTDTFLAEYKTSGGSKLTARQKVVVRKR